MEKSGIKDGKK